MNNYIRIESDGTALGTKAFYPNGEQIGGIVSFTFPSLDNESDDFVTLVCELNDGERTRTSAGPMIQVKSDGTSRGTKVLAPDGVHLFAKEMEIAKITHNAIPTASITFYLNRKKAEKKVNVAGASPRPFAAFPGLDSKTTTQFEALKQIAEKPTWDGNLISKTARDGLLSDGFIDRHRGWNFLSKRGVEVCDELKILKC